MLGNFQSIQYFISVIAKHINVCWINIRNEKTLMTASQYFEFVIQYRRQRCVVRVQKYIIILFVLKIRIIAARCFFFYFTRIQTTN